MSDQELFSIVIPTFNEEEHIEHLIRSIYNQYYRPIELIIVDGGSEDNTLEIILNLKTLLEENIFRIKVLDQRDFSKIRGPANARNIGFKNSKGMYIQFADADHEFTQRDFLDRLKIALKSSQVVKFKMKVIIDNWLEYQQVLDYNSIPFHGKSYAFRREVLRISLFDPKLGVGEDMDFLRRLSQQGLLENNALIGVAVGTHLPHSIKRYRIERFWHGKSMWSYLRKYPELKNYLKVISRASPPLILILSILFLFLFPVLSLFLFSIFIMQLIYLFVKSPIKTLDRLGYLIFRLTFGCFCFNFGFLKGLIDIFLGKFHPGRDT